MTLPHFLTATAVLAVMASTAPRAALAQNPPRDRRPPLQQQTAVGTAVISGTVTMAGSTQPARKARVSLSGAELGRGRSVITDDQGQFSFTSLPAGRYNLNATRPGYVSVSFGQRRPGGPGTPIQLSDGQKFQAHLQIPRGSVITGTVLDENGEPAPQTQVRVMRIVVQNGRRTVQGSNSSGTDDRGIYRVFGLLPGDYVVCATPRNTNLGDLDRMVVELQALRQSFESISRADPGQARAIGDRIASLQSAMPESTDESTPGYASVCYPGTVTATAAAPVTVGIAEERAGIDFQLQLMSLARVEGTVMNPTGAEVRGINVTLTDPQPTGFSVGNISARADADGRFRLMNVPPGQYRVIARGIIAPPRPAGAPAGGRGFGPGGGRVGPLQAEPVTLWGAADIAVDGRNVPNVLLSLQQGVSVSGQVNFEGASAPPSDLTRIRVSMSPAEPTGFGGAASARVDAAGRFTIPSVAPGRYRLNASGAGSWTVESAAIGGQDALDFPVEIKGNQTVGGAVIAFTDRQTELTGVLTDSKNQPAPDLTIVVFPADSRYWAAGTRRIQSARPATDGRYTFRNLPPGEYRLAPLYDLEPGATSDPAFLQQLEATALRVTLQAGEKKTQDIRLGGM